MTTHLPAAGIVQLLATKHAEDVFVAECKNGPTHTRQHRRLDAWVLKRTWSPVTTVGYEVKVSRSDFVGDDKWPAYLPLCHQLFFICPHGLIQPAEVPAGVGLLWATKQGRLLQTKVKAPRREISLPVDLMTYVIMARSGIGADRLESRTPNTDRWRDWLAEKQDKQRLGYDVSKRIRDIVAAHEAEVRKCRELVEGYESIRARITEMGFDPDRPYSSWDVRRKLERLVGGTPAQLARELRGAARKCAEAADELDPVAESERR